MRKKLTLESLIIDFLSNVGDSSKEEIVDFLIKETNVPLEKITFRIKKLIERKKLFEKEGIIGINIQENAESLLDDIVEIGPVKLSRKGRNLRIESKLSKEDLEKLQNKVKQALPDSRKELSQIFQQLETIIRESDPLDTLAIISIDNLFVDPQKYTESSFEGKQLFPEIIQNIILRNQAEKYANTQVHQSSLIKIEELLDNLQQKVIDNLMVETLSRDDLSQIEKDVLFKLLIEFLIVRGEAYPQHFKEISTELFSAINCALKVKGFTIEEYWSTIDDLKIQIEEKFNKLIKNPKRIIPHPKEIFKIALNERVNQKLLDILAVSFGGNESWLSPLDKSEIAIKPIIKINNEYYCFLHMHLIRNSVQIIESLLTEEDKLQINYSDIKGQYFEEKTLRLLERITGSKAFGGLIYPKRTEIDGILPLQDTVFLIEIKGKKKRIIAGVDNILKITKDDFIANVNNAFEQSERAYNYVLSRDEAEFKDKTGSIVLKLRREAIKKFYLVNVCVDSFTTLTMDINGIKEWDSQLLNGKNYPWIMTIYDLMVFGDLLENQPEAFIGYLAERIECAMRDELHAGDELDFLGYFFEKGSLKDKYARYADYATVNGFSEGIDRWYSFLRGEVSSANKPTLKKLKGKT